MNVIVIANQKGDVGKTTIAMQLGAALSRRHDVLVIDADRQGSAAWCADRSRDSVPFDLAATQSLLALGRIRELAGRYHYVLVDTPSGVESGR
jgi:chromosome partitioning protein